MKQFNKKAVKAIIIAAFLFTLTSQLVIMFESAATMDIYLMPEYFPVWSKLMMPDMGPPPLTFFVISVLVSFALALIYAVVFRIVAHGIPGEGITKGLAYGLILFFLSGVPSLLGMFLLINLPAKFFIAGTVSALASSLIGGIIIAWSVEKFGV
jgi:sterol desaturase/sphingolipid hydroxylase (fatty acid hydroxylase superfamily)